MSLNKILIPFIIINLLIIITGYIFGFSKSLWLDELLSVIFSREIIGLPLKETFTTYPHPPFFYVVLNIGEHIIKFFTLDVNDNLSYLKLVNLIGLIPIYLSFKILKKERTPINLYIVFLLLISSNYFIFYILDLRPYFLLLSFSLLVNVLNLTNTLDNKHKSLFLISAIVLSALHIYGLAISMSIISYRLMLNLFKKDYYTVKINIIFSIILFFVFLIFYLLQITDKETMATLEYIKINFWYFRIFIEWTISSLTYIFAFSTILFFQFRKNILSLGSIKDYLRSDFLKTTMSLSLPAIILVVVIMSISYLIIPIIHFKPLIVIFPSLVLYSGIIGFYLKKTKMILFVFLVFLIFLSSNNLFSYLKNIKYASQNVEWVIKKTFTKSCKGTDVYFNDKNKSGFVKIAKQISEIYSIYDRPIKSLSEIDISNHKAKYNKVKCDTLIFSFHNYGLENLIEKKLSKKFNLTIKYAPDVVNENSSKAGAVVYLNEESK